MAHTFESTFESKAYHRFFEGYVEEKVACDNRRGYKIQRTYEGPRMTYTLSGSELVRRKTLLCLCWLLALSLFLGVAYPSNGVNSVWYVGIPEAFALLGFIWLGTGIFHILSSKTDMEVRIFRISHVRSQMAAGYTAVILYVTAATTLIYSILQDRILSLLPEVAALAVAGTGMVLLYHMVVTMSYKIQRGHLRVGDDIL
jgi:hypothetical protein